MTDQAPIQHKPKHLEGDAEVFDRRHPAASAFAPAQPAAGVVSDDAEERGQNLAGGEKASDANETWSDQKEVLEQQHEDNLRRAHDQATPGAMKLEGDKATPADGGDEDKAPAKKAAPAPKPAPKP